MGEKSIAIIVDVLEQTFRNLQGSYQDRKDQPA
jgi:hypothetical protein